MRVLSQHPILRSVAFVAAHLFLLFGLLCLYDALRGRFPRWFEELIHPI